MTSKPTLKRSIGLAGAVLLGLGSIIGTGVFVSLGLAVEQIGSYALLSLVFAAGLASMNALSSAQLAANHPVSGGTYAYAYRYLNPYFGFSAGAAFLLAKSASAAAAAIGLVGYLATIVGWPGLPTNILACGLVLLITLLVALGVHKANRVNAVLVGFTLFALTALIIFSLIAPAVQLDAEPSSAVKSQTITQLTSFYWPNFFEAAALLFVAFTGYGRIATLGEEVHNPRQVIPKAIIITLCVATLLYLLVLISGLRVLGENAFALATQASVAPLEAIATKLDNQPLKILIVLSAITAMASVLLNLILGLSRVAFAMGRQADLPQIFEHLDRNHQPFIAIWVIGGFIGLLALFGGIKLVWGFSAFTVLVYYFITNLASFKLSPSERFYSRAVPVAGMIGCVCFGIFLNPKIIIMGSVILCSALAVRQLMKLSQK